MEESWFGLRVVESDNGEGLMAPRKWFGFVVMGVLSYYVCKKKFKAKFWTP